ncbi:iron-sulfur cluster repair di-iron protein [Paenibacillus fonticola]|uniref:iron-sulfur cluster repair di-iron protein n=1 Tax=Paenibacillus fonticola TaxID=379896 RepID=UPI00036EF48E|nr:iron-sulfur cluster repair di-iron protein [Paenibacillus fonticola]
MEQQYLHENTLVRDVVVRYPRTADYFRNHRIDFCCGGNRPLREAADESSVSVEQLIEELNEFTTEQPFTGNDYNWAEAESGELISHIVSKHHAYLREELPELQKYVTKVARVHGDSEPHLLEMQSLFGQLKHELLEHTDKEEAEVFPKMVNSDLTADAAVRAKLREAIEALEAEHDTAGNILKQIRRITQDFEVPDHACTTYRLTYARLSELEEMTFTHVHLENNILFPRYE